LQTELQYSVKSAKSFLQNLSSHIKIVSKLKKYITNLFSSFLNTRLSQKGIRFLKLGERNFMFTS